MAPAILRDTGTVQNAIEVHLVPLLRSALREQGKSIKLKFPLESVHFSL